MDNDFDVLWSFNYFRLYQMVEFFVKMFTVNQSKFPSSLWLLIKVRFSETSWNYIAELLLSGSKNLMDTVNFLDRIVDIGAAKTLGNFFKIRNLTDYIFKVFESFNYFSSSQIVKIFVELLTVK